MGWNGDINVFVRAAVWLSDVHEFLRRHLRAMRDLQAPSGRFTDVAPVGHGFGGTLWGSAGVVLPWELFRHYGDTTLLREHYPAMRAYVDYLESKQNADGILLEGPLGDWLSPEHERNDNTLLWKAYQVYLLRIVAKCAFILGETNDVVRFNHQYGSQRAFLEAFYFRRADGLSIHSGANAPRFGPPPPVPPRRGDTVDTQASYAIPLAFGLLNEPVASRAAAQLDRAIRRENRDDGGTLRPAYSLMTGFIGTAAVANALTDYGYDSTAYRLLQRETYPSWLYLVKNGATTIWERLNSYTHDDGFGGNNAMNSFNHYAFGAVADWMYRYCLGYSTRHGRRFSEFCPRAHPRSDGADDLCTGALRFALRTDRKQLGTRCERGGALPVRGTAEYGSRVAGTGTSDGSGRIGAGADSGAGR